MQIECGAVCSSALFICGIITFMRVKKNQFLKWFAITVAVLAMVRLFFPSIAKDRSELPDETVVDSTSLSSVFDSLSVKSLAEALFHKSPQTEAQAAGFSDSLLAPNNTDTLLVINGTDSLPATPVGKSFIESVRDMISKRTQLQPANSSPEHVATRYTDSQGNPLKNPILGVSSYKEVFPDSNDLQLSAATRIGVSPIANRAEAEAKKSELVFVGANPYFVVQKLNNSIPYLVPKASLLLQDIGRNFFDSLQVKQIPLHKIIVTSVLRTTDDVEKLRGRNRNATENSCHLYGTTFDICYNRYVTVQNPDGPKKREVSNDSLKWVLSEVLRDLRNDGRCYIKHEVKQGCFHITTR